MNSKEDLKSVIRNVTIAFYQFTLNTLYEEVDGEIRFTAKALKDVPEMYTKYTKSRYVSNPYHKAVRVSLFNPCTDGVVAEEMIRRDKAFYSVLLETGINLQRTTLMRDYTIKSVLALLGLKSGSQIDDSDLYSLSASPLKLYNFKDLFILQFFAAIIALFIEFGNHVYKRYVKLNLN